MPATSGPELAPILGVELSAPAEIRALLAQLQNWFRVRIGGHPDADVLLTDKPTAARAAKIPLVLLGRAADDWWRAPDLPAHLLLSADREVLGSGAAAALSMSLETGIPQAAPLSPFMRERVRRARGLAEPVVVVEGAHGWLWPDSVEPMADELVDTALALCGAAVATSVAGLVRSWAWAAPTVASGHAAAHPDAQSAARICPRSAEAPAVARELAADQVAAAALSWRGRQAYEMWHDVRRTALSIASRTFPRRLSESAPGLLLDLRLAELGCPPDAIVRQRADEAAELLRY